MPSFTIVHSVLKGHCKDYAKSAIRQAACPPFKQIRYGRIGFKEEEGAVKVDLHEGCGRIKLYWTMIGLYGTH
uniref:Uncharacterized protein n=1 Tax=Amphimedon queenslandica TaxID=400682 RepID=A0A1X7SZD9_AMPQE